MTSRKRILLSSLLLVVLALLVRGLFLEDGLAQLHTPEQEGIRMARRYDDSARAILSGEGILFPKVPDPSKTGLAARPPGYAIFLAFVYKTLGRSLPLVALVQDVLTALAVLLVFSFGQRLFGFLAGLIGAVLVAISPHIAATSNMILADAIAPIPLLLGFYLALPLFHANPTLRESGLRLAGMGALIGCGVWLRPNVVLLGPFAAVFLHFLLGRGLRGLSLGLLPALVSLLVVAPITVRNWLVFGEFVPVSINGGITLWQGVADAGGREYGARVWDKQVMAEEAERYGRPDYLLWWAEPEGIARDRDRYRRAMEVIRARPLWYAGAMVRRMASMLLLSDGPEALLPSGAAPERLSPEEIPLTPVPGLDKHLNEEVFARGAGAASFLRGPLRLAHRLWPLIPALICVGMILSMRRDPRVTVFWLIVPAYYLVFESPFLYEWRVAVPMQYFLLPFAAKAITDLAGSVARRLVRQQKRL